MIHEINDGGPAYPTHPPAITDMARRIHGSEGASLRDYFAIRVDMTGVAQGALEALEGPFPAYADAKARQDGMREPRRPTATTERMRC